MIPAVASLNKNIVGEKLDNGCFFCAANGGVCFSALANIFGISPLYLPFEIIRGLFKNVTSR